MILAEDLLLLTYDDESGAADPLIDAFDQRLAGALLVELALTGRVEITTGPETLPDGGGFTDLDGLRAGLSANLRGAARAVDRPHCAR